MTSQVSSEECEHLAESGSCCDWGVGENPVNRIYLISIPTFYL